MKGKKKKQKKCTTISYNGRPITQCQKPGMEVPSAPWRSGIVK